MHNCHINYKTSQYFWREWLEFANPPSEIQL